jgi:hypothetical protein
VSGQNRSSAVMQQRSEPHDSLDDFPTPPWATRALCEFLQANLGFDLSMMSCREPAANRGHMVHPLLESFGHIAASDIHDYGAGFRVEDYLFGPDQHWDRTDFTITNPPFKLAEQFIERALRLSRVGCAVIVRAAFLEGVGRYSRLFAITPPSYVLQFTERVVMHKGRLAPEGSTATAYAWLVWINDDQADTRLRWIAPCRKRLERPSDYEAAQ